MIWLVRMKETSDHFDGRRYFNPAVSNRPFWKIIRWILNRKVKPWPSIAVEQKKVQKDRTEHCECRVTFINHSTVLLQLEGLNILTDPIWSERASPFSWMGPKRVVLPGIKFEDLPPIDIVILSHNHYDHMDLPTLRLLSKTHHPRFFVPKGNQSYLKRKGIQSIIDEMDWWDQIEISKDYRLHFVPAQHFSSRGILDRNATLWGGFVFKSTQEMIYFAGDTGYGPHFAEIHRRFGPPTLSILPIGAFEPRSIMDVVHLSPDEAVKIHSLMHSKQSLAIHFGTFQLTDEDIHHPAEQLQSSLQHQQLSSDAFWVLNPGDSRIVFKKELHNKSL